MTPALAARRDRRPLGDRRRRRRRGRHHAGGRRPKPVTHTVTIDATRYHAGRLTVHVGDTVVWVNKDLIPHTATAKGGGIRLEGAGDGRVLAIHGEGEGGDATTPASSIRP